MSEHKCEGKVWGRMQYRPCGRTGRYEHEGQRYCKTHHPPTVKAYEDARNEKWQAKWSAQEQAWKETEEARAEMQRRAAAYDGLVAQRDALLEALRTLLSYANVLEMRLVDADGEHRAMQQARAAIKMAEEGK